MPIRTIIVDDEELARARLRSLLRVEPDIDVVAECGDGPSAVAAIAREAPDLLLLDVQIPEVDGFGVLERIDEARRPVVIFVTAYGALIEDAKVAKGDFVLIPAASSSVGLAAIQIANYASATTVALRYPSAGPKYARRAAGGFALDARTWSARRSNVSPSWGTTSFRRRFESSTGSSGRR